MSVGKDILGDLSAALGKATKEKEAELLDRQIEDVRQKYAGLIANASDLKQTQTQIEFYEALKHFTKYTNISDADKKRFATNLTAAKQNIVEIKRNLSLLSKTAQKQLGLDTKDLESGVGKSIRKLKEANSKYTDAVSKSYKLQAITRIGTESLSIAKTIITQALTLFGIPTSATGFVQLAKEAYTRTRDYGKLGNQLAAQYGLFEITPDSNSAPSYIKEFKNLWHGKTNILKAFHDRYTTSFEEFNDSVQAVLNLKVDLSTKDISDFMNMTYRLRYFGIKSSDIVEISTIYMRKFGIKGEALEAEILTLQNQAQFMGETTPAFIRETSDIVSELDELNVSFTEVGNFLLKIQRSDALEGTGLFKTKGKMKQLTLEYYRFRRGRTLTRNPNMLYKVLSKSSKYKNLAPLTAISKFQTAVSSTNSAEVKEAENAFEEGATALYKELYGSKTDPFYVENFFNKFLDMNISNELVVLISLGLQRGGTQGLMSNVVNSIDPVINNATLKYKEIQEAYERNRKIYQESAVDQIQAAKTSLILASMGTPLTEKEKKDITGLGISFEELDKLKEHQVEYLREAIPKSLKGLQEQITGFLDYLKRTSNPVFAALNAVFKKVTGKQLGLDATIFPQKTVDLMKQVVNSPSKFAIAIPLIASGIGGIAALLTAFVGMIVKSLLTSIANGFDLARKNIVGQPEDFFKRMKDGSKKLWERAKGFGRGVKKFIRSPIQTTKDFLDTKRAQKVLKKTPTSKLRTPPKSRIKGLPEVPKRTTGAAPKSFSNAAIQEAKRQRLLRMRSAAKPPPKGARGFFWRLGREWRQTQAGWTQMTERGSNALRWTANFLKNPRNSLATMRAAKKAWNVGRIPRAIGSAFNPMTILTFVASEVAITVAFSAYEHYVNSTNPEETKEISSKMLRRASDFQSAAKQRTSTVKQKSVELKQVFTKVQTNYETEINSYTAGKGEHFNFIDLLVLENLRVSKELNKITAFFEQTTFKKKLFEAFREKRPSIYKKEEETYVGQGISKEAQRLSLQQALTTIVVKEGTYSAGDEKKGKDILIKAKKPKTNVYALAPGTVSFVREGRVILEHVGGYKTVYFNLSSVNVRVNQTISSQQVLGITGDKQVGFQILLEDKVQYGTGAESSWSKLKTETEAARQESYGQKEARIKATVGLFPSGTIDSRWKEKITELKGTEANEIIQRIEELAQEYKVDPNLFVGMIDYGNPEWDDKRETGLSGLSAQNELRVFLKLREGRLNYQNEALNQLTMSYYYLVEKLAEINLLEQKLGIDLAAEDRFYFALASYKVGTSFIQQVMDVAKEKRFQALAFSDVFYGSDFIDEKINQDIKNRMKDYIIGVMENIHRNSDDITREAVPIPAQRVSYIRTITARATPEDLEKLLTDPVYFRDFLKIA